AGTCCDPDATCCEGTCCDPGVTCCGGTCCFSDQPCCGGRCCDFPGVCQGGACICNTTLCLGSVVRCPVQPPPGRPRCFIIQTTEGNCVCAEADVACSAPCTSSDDCPDGFICQGPGTGCCGPICLRVCGTAAPAAAAAVGGQANSGQRNLGP